ncbi:MAG: hypothetical protein ACTSYD_12920 [Candidatus Heimdallarchaeaceae archaeon]
MSTLTPIKRIGSLIEVTNWMLLALEAYEQGTVSGKLVSKSARKLLKQLERYVPSSREKNHHETVTDLCISLSTIERAVGPFKPFYLESLREELKKAHSLLEGNKE